MRRLAAVAAVMLAIGCGRAQESSRVARASRMVDGLLVGDVRSDVNVGDTLLVRVIMRVDTIGGRRVGLEGRYWGSPAAPPTTAVVWIGATWGGKEVEVPLSAYADLSDVSGMSVVRAESGVEVRIAGGDAGGAYDATILMSKKRVVKRWVKNGEFPENIWEETMYVRIPVE